MNTISKRAIKQDLIKLKQHLFDLDLIVLEDPVLKPKMELSRKMAVYTIKINTYLHNGDKVNARKYIDKYKQNGHAIMDILMESNGNCMVNIIDVVNNEKTDNDYWGGIKDDENSRRMGNTLMEEINGYEHDILCILIP